MSAVTMKNEPTVLSELLDDLRQEIVRQGWFAFVGPDPLLEVVLGELGLPVPVIQTLLDDDDTCPEQTLPAALARIIMRITVAQNGSTARSDVIGTPTYPGPHERNGGPSTSSVERVLA